MDWRTHLEEQFAKQGGSPVKAPGFHHDHFTSHAEEFGNQAEQLTTKFPRVESAGVAGAKIIGKEQLTKVTPAKLPRVMLPRQVGAKLYQQARVAGARLQVGSGGEVYFDVRIVWQTDASTPAPFKEGAPRP